MKAFKKLTITTTVIAGLAVLGSGSYNSMVMQDTAFMSDNSGIKFAKRLDEMNGKVVVGRMAASTPKWTSLSEVKNKEVAPKVEVVAKKEVVEQEQQEVVAFAEPAIQGDLELKVTNVFFKEALKDGQFTGSARSVDGVVEEIYVNLPNGQTINVNSRERMEGNVFVYEDEATGEEARGMFYEVKEGTYMVTLTNDSRYAGARMELKVEGGAQVAYEEGYYDRNLGWTTDSQNHEEELAQGDEALRVQDQYEDDNYNDYEDGYQDNAEKEGEFGFNFQV
ncbi:MAG: hypothetical protein KC478_03070 [Bacteriovoracaceae bacterium]|nr:hypothetical protein [Bacteriovoracaceae bacterium]